jgi:ferredoxin
VCRLVKEYNLDFNILKASITPDDEGLMVLELRGKQADYDKGIGYLTKTGLKIQPLSQNVIRNEERCTHCGACVAICPAAAFELDPVTRLVDFRDEKCLVCGICLTACPPRAMELHF